MGCSKQLTKTEIVKVPTPVFPDDSFLLDCHETSAKDIITNLDLLNYAVSLRNDLRVCNVDKQSLRVWKDSFKK